MTNGESRFLHLICCSKLPWVYRKTFFQKLSAVWAHNLQTAHLAVLD